MLAVRGADGLVVADRPPLDAAELAIVSEAPGSSPELAHEGMGVGDRDATAVGAADMRDSNEARDRVLDQEPGERGLCAGRRIVEGAAAIPVMEDDAETVAVAPCHPRAPHQSRKAEAQIRRNIGAHAQQLAHAYAPWPGAAPFARLRLISVC